ncbi:MAG: hypothetical protein ABI391_05255, partial [Hyphomicrobiaceae bacterium]
MGTCLAMDSQRAIGNGHGIDAGSGPGGTFRVAVCGRAAAIAGVVADLARLAGAQPSLALDIVEIASKDDGPGAMVPLLDVLPSAALAIVVADGANHLSGAARATCLLAWRLTGAAPVLAAAEDASGAA